MNPLTGSTAVIDVDACSLPGFGLSEELTAGQGDWHQHRLHQVLYASRGVIHLETQAATWLLPPQRAAWIGAGVPHRVAVNPPGASLRTAWLAPELSPLDLACQVFRVDGLAREMLVKATDFPPDRGSDLGNHFFRTLAGLCTDWVQDSCDYRLVTGQSDEVRRTMRWTLDNLRQARASEAAKAGGMAPRTMARKFTAETGASWRDYLHAARMLTALELLDGGTSVTDTGLMVGYSSMSAFSTGFRTYFGVKPSQAFTR